jgi:hypothetical protein
LKNSWAALNAQKEALTRRWKARTCLCWWSKNTTEQIERCNTRNQQTAAADRLVLFWLVVVGSCILFVPAPSALWFAKPFSPGKEYTDLRA